MVWGGRSMMKRSIPRSGVAWVAPAFAAAALATPVAALLGPVAPLAAQEVPEKTLVKPSATFPEGFARLSGLRELPDRRVMIADGLGQVVVIADLASGVANTIGGEGQGPDEYLQPDGLFPLPRGATLLVDLGNGRLTAIAEDGAFGETSKIAQPGGDGLMLVLPRATDGDGRIYFQHMGGMGAGRGFPDSSAVVRWDRTAGAFDTVALVKLPDRKVDRSGSDNERSVRVQPVPLSREDAWAVAGDGRVAIARAGTEEGVYRVEWILPDGHVVRAAPARYRPAKVSAAEKEEWVTNLSSNGLRVMVTNDNGSLQASFSRGGSGRGTPDVDGFDWPDVLPPFAANAVDVAPDGSAWVTRQVPAGDAPLVDVFGPDGSLRARIRLPVNREVAGFGADAVYLVRTDELDFQWLERYELPSL